MQLVHNEHENDASKASMPNQASTDLSKIGEIGSDETNGLSALETEKAGLELKGLIDDGKHGLSLKKHMHCIAVGVLYICSAVMLSLIVVRGIHFIIAEDSHWLTSTELHNIERIIFSGIVIALASKYSKKYNLL